MATLPIASFLTEVLTEFDPSFELRTGTGFERLFFEPLEFIVQPLRDEMDNVETAQSFALILATPNPDTFDQASVDALAANLFVTRMPSGFGGGTATALYNLPVDIEYPAGGATFVDSSGNTYVNTTPFLITAQQMSLQILNGLYYFNIEVIATVAGTAGNIPPNSLVQLLNDVNVVQVTNQEAFEGGLTPETNTQLITRTQNSIGVRDLVTGKGFQGILFETFVSTLVEAQPIGFGDPEMQRDIVYNVHIGGRVDGYVKCASIQQGFTNFVGLLIDVTRQTFTTANVQLLGTAPTFIGNPNIDNSHGLLVIVQEIKVSTQASFISSADLSSPIDLTAHQYVQIGIDGVFTNIRIAGAVPSSTTRNEIVTLINNAVGENVAFVYGNNYIRILSPTYGLTSQVVIANPTVGTNALLQAFGLSPGGSPYIYDGDGPVTYVEGVNYSIDYPDGDITRIVGTIVLGTQTNGQTTMNHATFVDLTPNVFLNVEVNDILTINTGPDTGDYRVVEVNTLNELTLDTNLTTTASSVSYQITEPGIKSGEFVYVQYYFNPLSIDIGNLVVLDPAQDRGIRPGRANVTITDLAFLRINSIELIDALSQQPIGTTLNGVGGYGQGGYGRGPYGIGSGADYYLVVNQPTARFSAFEDSYIVINVSFSGLSFRVNYDFVPQIEDYHAFVRSDQERVLDGDILMKHYLPAYVSGTINYSASTSNSAIPSTAALTLLVKQFITSIPSGTNLVISNLEEYILSQIDPFFQYGAYIQPMTLIATIHNTDGSITMISSDDQLVIPALNPFPSQTNAPLSARITHWIGDQIVMNLL